MFNSIRSQITKNVNVGGWFELPDIRRKETNNGAGKYNCQTAYAIKRSDYENLLDRVRDGLYNSLSKEDLDRIGQNTLDAAFGKLKD